MQRVISGQTELINYECLTSHWPVFQDLVVCCRRCSGVGLDSVPETMINLEMWMEAGFNKAPWVDTTRLTDAGPLGPYGRSDALSSCCLLTCFAVVCLR